MHRNFIRVLLSIFLSFPVILMSKDFNPEKGEPPDIIVKDGRQRYLDTVFDSIEIQQDIVFGESITHAGKKEALLLDIYTPANDPLKNRPAILWIHGGGFRLQNDKSQSYIVEMATRFARRGYVCVSINYRVRENPGDDWPGTLTDALEDAMKGLDWLRNTSSILGVDPSKIVMGGGSAGGMVAVNFCYRGGVDPGEWDKSGIIALVNLWGSPDPLWSDYKVTRSDPPAIIVHGTEDALVSFSNSLELVNELNLAGVKNELVSIEGAGHTPASHMDVFAKKISQFLFHILSKPQ